MWACLDEEFITPAIECLERLGTIHIVHEYAAIRTTIERHPKRLEPFLTCGIPQLVNMTELQTGRQRGNFLAVTCIVTRRSSTMTSFVKLDVEWVCYEVYTEIRYWLRTSLLR
jgi:hypothetical protein